MIETGINLHKPVLEEEKTAGILSLISSKPQDTPSYRARRVTVLLAGILVLSIADLLATITHLKTVGMVEFNPIAAFIIKTTNSVWGLAVFKLMSVSLCVILLYRLRRHIQGEIASWLCLIILILLILYWGHYTNITILPDTIPGPQTGIASDHWLILND